MYLSFCDRELNPNSQAAPNPFSRNGAVSERAECRGIGELLAEHGRERLEAKLKSRELVLLDDDGALSLWKPALRHAVRQRFARCGEYWLSSAAQSGWVEARRATVEAGASRHATGHEPSLSAVDLAPSLHCESTAAASSPCEVELPLQADTLTPHRPPSWRESGGAPIALDDLSRFLSALEGWQGRPAFAAAGGIYDYDLVLVSDAVYGLERGLWRVNKRRLARLAASPEALFYLHAQARTFLFSPQYRAAAVVLVLSDLDRLSKKYRHSARDYALLTCGGIINAAYSVGDAIGLGICGLGRLDLEPIEAAIGLHQNEYLGSFCIGSKNDCR